MSEGVDDVPALLNAATYAADLGVRALYLARARAHLQPEQARLDSWRLLLSAAEAELARLVKLGAK